MSRYLASRAVQTVVTLVLMSVVVYLLIGLMPGDPIDMMIAGDPKMTSADVVTVKISGCCATGRISARWRSSSGSRRTNFPSRATLASAI